MTVVAAWWTATAGYIAADSWYQWGGLGSLQTGGMAKIGRGRDYLFGLSGVVALTQPLRRILTDAPEADLADNWSAYRAHMKTAGHGEQRSGLWTLDVSVVTVSRGGVWLLDGSGLFERASETYAAIGFGRDHAYGAGVVLDRHHRRAEVAARIMVEAACVHAVGCGGAIQTDAMTWGTR